MSAFNGELKVFSGRANPALTEEICNYLDIRPGRVHGVRIRPGKPVAYGRGPNGQHVFGLPGNPVSAFVCATVFAQMAIRALRGHPIRPPKMLRAHNARRLDPKGDDRPAFLPALVWQDAKGKYWADACAWRGSGDPFGLVMANGLMLRRDPTGVLEAGDGVEVVEIG